MNLDIKFRRILPRNLNRIQEILLPSQQVKFYFNVALKMPLHTHEISLQGLSGAIFWMVMVAVIFYTLGFATVGWVHENGMWKGLWLSCYANPPQNAEDYLKATQAMITIGLILLIGSMITIFLYMFVHSLSLNKTVLLQVFAGLAFAAVLFMLIGFIIFGAKEDNLNWSYAFCVIGSIFCLVGGILSVVQMKQSSVI